MNSPSVAVILPVYNTARTVVRSIDSILHQTHTNFELVIINDSSPDDADRVIRQHLEQTNDSRVRYVVNEHNLGLAGSRNRGLRTVSSDWVAFLDSDDVFHPEFLEKMLASAGPTTDVVVCSHDVLYPDGTHRYRSRGRPGRYTGNQPWLS